MSNPYTASGDLIQRLAAMTGVLRSRSIEKERAERNGCDAPEFEARLELIADTLREQVRELEKLIG